MLPKHLNRILCPGWRSISIQSRRGKHTLPDLPYDYNALEPVISAEIMKLHHSKHHQGYVNNLIVAEEKFGEAKLKNDLATMIALQPAIQFNGGGLYFMDMYCSTCAKCYFKVM